MCVLISRELLTRVVDFLELHASGPVDEMSYAQYQMSLEAGPILSDLRELLAVETIMDAEEIYHKLRQFAETLGFVNAYADEKLSEAAKAIYW